MAPRQTATVPVPGYRAPDPQAGPSSPGQLPRGALWTAVRRTLTEFARDNGFDWAAALTYYGVLSIFPGLLVLVSLVGLFSRASIQPLLDSLSEAAPGPVQSILHDSVAGLEGAAGRAGLVAVIGIVIGLWSASGYVGAFMRASNAMYDVPEGRPLWKTVPIRLGITVATGVLLVLSAGIVLITGDLASAVGRGLGFESATVAVWGVAKWPVLLVLVAAMFALLYWASPNARQGGPRWVSPGGLVAVTAWVAASALFGVYVANFGSYDKTYGTLGAVVVFLVWLWISNLAILFGAELNAELERQRAIAAGLPPTAEPYLRLRDDRAVKADRDQGLGETAGRPSAPARRSRPSAPALAAARPAPAGPDGRPASREVERRRAAPVPRSVSAAVAGGALLVAVWALRRRTR